MTKKTTPEKPPSDAMERIAGKGLSKGKLTPAATRSLAGRVLSERSATTKKSGK